MRRVVDPIKNQAVYDDWNDAVENGVDFGEEIYSSRCDIVLNGKTQYEDHSLGKKHRRSKQDFRWIRVRSALPGELRLCSGVTMHDIQMKLQWDARATCDEAV